ncbi:exosome complex protein RRP46 [Acrasis kona]|uniref:Exosome complex protein RRP46 n=1 Tax=Acrasis kona TaxID=1008807 RepID=A0AAW2Z1A7_9EUKA
MSTLVKRQKGRLSNQLRSIEAQLGLLNKADGSAKYKQGDSSVLAAVYGPSEVLPKDEKGDRASVQVVFKRRDGKPGRREKQNENIIRNALEPIIMTHLYPRTAIMIIVQVLVDDGSILSVALNACVLALMDAGVPISTVISSISCSIVVDENGSQTLLTDPDLSEERTSIGETYFVFDGHVVAKTGEGGLVSSVTSGLLTDSAYTSCLTASRSGSKSVYTFIRETLKRKPTTVMAPIENIIFERDEASSATNGSDFKMEDEKEESKTFSNVFMKPI